MTMMVIMMKTMRMPKDYGNVVQRDASHPRQPEVQFDLAKVVLCSL